MKAPFCVAALLAAALAIATGPRAVAQSQAPAPAAPAAAPAAPAAATSAPHGAPTAPAAKRAPAATPALTPDQARDVLDTLNDPRKRAAFAATLEAIVKGLPQQGAAAAAGSAAAGAESADQAPPGDAAAPPAEGDAPKPDLALPLKPDSLGARLLVSASGVLAEASDRAEAAVATMNSLPALWHWIVVMTTDPWGRGVLIDTSWRLVVVFLVAVSVEYGLRRLLRRPRAALVALGRRHIQDDIEPVPDGDGEEATDATGRQHHLWRVSALGMLRRLPLTLGRLFLDLMPVLGFLLVAHLVIGSPVGGQLMARLVLIALVGAYALCAAVLSLVRSLIAPNARGLRLFDISDDTAAYIMRWTRRIVVLTVFGYAAGEAGRLLGLSDDARDVLMKGVGLVDHVMLAVIVLEKRRAVRAWIRPPRGASGMWARLRERFAGIWHWIALFYIAAVWIVWAVEIPEGFSKVLRLVVLTTAVLLVARFALILLRGALDRVAEAQAETSSKYPEIAGRLRLWRPVLHMLVNALVYLVTFIELLQVWGVGAIGWLTGTDLGRHVLSAISTMLFTLLVAIAVWEAANHAIERHLAKLAREAQLARSARLRTLLPMLRTALLITIVVVVGLLVLSEIGLNIAPLLAGAGVLGIAIGFGSQKLVQDVITGLFLLLENTVQVGDVVSLGGLTGVVEELSIRTIRLRSEDGSVHVIPFSAVTTVTNMTRDFGHAVIEVGVAYKEDYDRVIAIMRDIVTGMRREPRWEDEIRDDLEVMGLNAFADSAVMIKARIKCGPFGRWALLREFNRRLKARFEQEGIEIPFPQRQLVLSQPIEIAGRAAGHSPVAATPLAAPLAAPSGAQLGAASMPTVAPPVVPPASSPPVAAQ